MRRLVESLTSALELAVDLCTSPLVGPCQGAFLRLGLDLRLAC